MTTQTFALTVPTSATLNVNSREHWRPRADKTRELRHAGWALAQHCTPMTRARCVVTLNFGDKRTRDPANWHPTAKALVDGLVDAGLLADDDATHLLGPDMRIGPVGARGVVTVTLTFTEMAA